jgi:hypothetical protein
VIRPNVSIFRPGKIFWKAFKKVFHTKSKIKQIILKIYTIRILFHRKSSAAFDKLFSEKKYFKRGDLIAKQREDYLALHAPKVEDVRKKVEEIEKAKEEGRRDRKKYFIVFTIILN